MRVPRGGKCNSFVPGGCGGSRSTSTRKTLPRFVPPGTDRRQSERGSLELVQKGRERARSVTWEKAGTLTLEVLSIRI